MLKNRKHLPAYPDGIVEVCNNRSKPTSFSASTNPRSRDDLELYATLHYSAEAIRESDQTMANAQGISVTLKLRTPFLDGVNVKQKAIIAGTLYDIVRVDPDKRNQLYIYLGGGRTLNEPTRRPEGDASEV